MNKARRIKIEKVIRDLEDILDQVIYAEEEEAHNFNLLFLQNARLLIRMAINNLEGSKK